MSSLLQSPPQLLDLSSVWSDDSNVILLHPVLHHLLHVVQHHGDLLRVEEAG